MSFAFLTILSWGHLLSLVCFAECPEWIKSKRSLPLCPEGKEVALLPETYPIGAVVVSDFGAITKSDPDYTVDVVDKVLKGAGEETPLIILPVRKETMAKVKSHIDSLPMRQDLKERWKSQLIQIPTQAYTWQQDYMQPFINPQNGKIVLREVEAYRSYQEHSAGSFQKIVEATKGCDIEEGPKLKSKELVGGNMGGNIESLPAGICLLGDDHFSDEATFKSYADQVCGKSPDDRVKVSTAWLKVGHTDEIMKVIRNKNQKAPCDFSIVLASPQKALELLKKNPKEPFLSFSSRSQESPGELTSRRIREHYGLNLICRKWLEKKNDSQGPGESRSNKTKGITKHFNFPRFSFFNKAFAEERVKGDECSQMTNEDVYRLFSEDKNFKDYNQLVQAEMDRLKGDIQLKLKKKLPACNLDFVQVPDLFFGGELVEDEFTENKMEGSQLPARMGHSVLPNPANSISVNETLISPEPSNKTFKTYLQEEYKKRGLKPEFIDTFDYAHQGNGNLHCSTSTMHVCRPRGNQ